MKKYFIVLFIMLISISSYAQLKIGVDIYSRYLWRGLNLGNAPALQPSIYYTISGFTICAWGSYSFPTSEPTYSENDLLASYSFTTEKSGSFTAILTDYYIPSLKIPFGYFKPKASYPAAHTIEGGFSYIGPETFPITLSLYTNLSNDPDNSTYIQVGYPINIEDAIISFATGFVPSKSAYYLVDKGNIINLSITGSKTIAITNKFSIPINVSYISNPSQDNTYLVFGVSFLF